MPLYKLFCIAAHYPEYRQIKDLVQSSAKFLLEQGCVVREVKYLGLRNLPQRMKRHKQFYSIGDYWHMNFDASPRTLEQLNRRMQDDHRVIRWTMLKLGEKLEDIVDTRQATVQYKNDLVTSNKPLGVWAYGDKLPHMPEMFNRRVDSEAALGTGTKTDGKVASMKDLFDDSTVASLGGTSYARDRL